MAKTKKPKTVSPKKPNLEDVGTPIGIDGKPKHEPIDIGNVRIMRTDGLYFVQIGSTFETPDGVTGEVCSALNGAMVVYVQDGKNRESYEISAHDVVQRILQYRAEQAAKVTTTEERPGEGERDA